MARLVFVLRILLFTTILSTFTTAQVDQNAPFALASIASAAPQSNSFALVADKACDASVVTVIYEMYSHNSMVFQTCVAQGKYNIFPFTGTQPTQQQIGAMARSLACQALFTAILLAGIPECEVSNFPMRAAAETLLKVAVDIDQHPDAVDAVPSTERFVQMMLWRRDVNLAATAGVPCDSTSQLYAEYSANLNAITTNGLVRLTADKEVQYRPTADGSFSQDLIVATPNVPRVRGSSSSIDGEIATVYPSDATVKPSISEAVHPTTTMNANQSTDTQQIENAATTAADSSNAADMVKWTKVQATFVVVIAAMLAFA